MKLYFFSSGKLKSSRDVFIAGEPKTPFIVPVPFYLIQHRGKNILFDCGNHKLDIVGGTGLVVSGSKPLFDVTQWAPQARKAIGVYPGRIDFLILSHLHHDHVGAATEFQHATVIAHRSEYDYAHRPDYFMSRAYYEAEFPKTLDWFLLEGGQSETFDLFGDGRICIINTFGHTPGHISLLVRTDKDGDMLLAADACYLESSLETGLIPGLVCDPTAYMQSIRLLRLMQKTGVKIIAGHDPEKWDGYRHAPEYYE
jgi:glyoxylase-like metal-dependent hydrolase (beta-lactamase superfamily II)